MRKQHEIFVKLVNELINDVIALYANDAEYLSDITFGWREYDEVRGSFAIGPNHSIYFNYADKVSKIAEACGMNWYISIGKNADGNDCAVICAF